MAIGPIGNLDYVVLPCRDIDRAVTFYRDVIGLRVEEHRPDWVNLRVGSSILALRRRRTDVPVPLDGVAQLSFRVPPSRLDACQRELAAHGVEIERGPVDLPSWGHRALFFRDPDGNLLEIYAEV